MKILNLKMFTFLILFFLISGYAFADGKLVLDLETSLDLAMKNNPDLKIAEKEMKKSKAAVWEAYANIMPQLDASASFQHSWDIQKSTIPNFIKTMMGPSAPPGMPDYVEIAFGLENTFNYGATFSQPLFLGWAGIAGINTSKAAERAAEHNVQMKRQNLIYQTANAFYTCLLAKELVTVQEEALEQAKMNLDVVQKKYNVGMASGFDKMRAEVEVANMRPDLISARNNYESAITQLRTVMGVSKDMDIEVTGAFKYSEDTFANQSLEDLQQTALKNRPEYLALEEQKQMSKQGITIARSEFLPKLFFQTEYSYMAMRDDYHFAQDDFNKGFTSALSLQIPLFSGFSSVKNYQKAKLDYKITLDTEKQFRDGIAAEVEIAHNKFNEAKEKFFSAKETVALAEEALRLANLMYEEGANTQLDVINSQMALTRAKMNYVRSLYDYQIARYQLRKASGCLREII